MSAAVLPFRRRFHRRLTGEHSKLRFTAHVEPSTATKGECSRCGGATRRSIYGILHDECSGCRHLVMIYGPSIEVRRVDD